jgi:hypothetical protein
LSELYNSAREAAEKKVRSLDVSCGPFDRYQVATKYDPEKLYNAVGPTEFRNLGGTSRLVAEYTIDKKVIEAAIARNEIPTAVLAVVRKAEPRYKVPPALKLP